jgi:hypothetical protein
MSVNTITEPVTPSHYLDDYDRAAELVRNKLGGVALATQGKRHLRCAEVRAHKAAVVREVARSPHIRSVTEAFRVVEAAYPFFSPDDQCTEEAMTAACGRSTAASPATGHPLRRCCAPRPATSSPAPSTPPPVRGETRPGPTRAASSSAYARTHQAAHVRRAAPRSSLFPYSRGDSRDD